MAKGYSEYKKLLKKREEIEKKREEIDKSLSINIQEEGDYISKHPEIIPAAKKEYEKFTAKKRNRTIFIASTEEAAHHYDNAALLYGEAGRKKDALRCLKNWKKESKGDLYVLGKSGEIAAEIGANDEAVAYAKEMISKAGGENKVPGSMLYDAGMIALTAGYLGEAKVYADALAEKGWDSKSAEILMRIGMTKKKKK